MSTIPPVKPRASGRRLLASALLAAGACGLLGGCAGWTQPEMSTEEFLKRQCEVHGGWWRGNLIPGYCEYQTASVQSP